MSVVGGTFGRRVPQRQGQRHHQRRRDPRRPPTERGRDQAAEGPRQEDPDQRPLITVPTTRPVGLGASEALIGTITWAAVAVKPTTPNAAANTANPARAPSPRGRPR